MAYHRAGYWPIPIRHASKLPHIQWKEYQKQAPSEVEVRHWWTKWPDAGIGLITGKESGLLVFDADTPAGETLIESLDLDPCPQATTGRGRHFYLLYPPDETIPNQSRASEGWDIKGDGGYVVAPPSIHPTGAQYEWFAGTEQLPRPYPNRSALQRLSTPIESIKRTANPPSTSMAANSRITEGQRNTTLASIAGALRHRGKSEEEIGTALEVVNRERCHPPLDDKEVAGIAKSYSKYPAGDSSISVSEHRTDLGNAKRLVARHGADLRYVHLWKKWLCWDDRRWRIDDSGETMRLAKATIGSLYEEAAGTLDGDRQELAKWAIKSEAEKRLQAMINLAQSEPGIPVAPDELDRDKWLLNCENGTLDLRTGILRPHDRNDVITKIVSAPYNPDAYCELWDSFLERIFEHNADLIAFVQRAAGYALTGETYEHCLFICYGKGRNGKSTLLEALAALLNDYAQQTPTETLLASQGSRIPNDVAQLKGARFVTAIEADEGRRLNEALVKQLTGGDRMSARFLHGEFFQYVPQCKLFLAVNHRPEIKGTDNAIWERIKLVPFDVTIPPLERDKELPDKLKAELSGILTWAVEGCHRWKLGGLGESREVVGATQAYRTEMDVLGSFIASDCLLGPGAKCQSNKLYEAYTQWCTVANEKPLRQKNFVARMEERGFRKEKSSVMVWSGIGLLSKEDS